MGFKWDFSRKIAWHSANQIFFWLPFLCIEQRSTRSLHILYIPFFLASSSSMYATIIGPAPEQSSHLSS